MKTMFRKAVSVLTSAAMVGLTVGTAAAVAYPAPFNAGNSAVVYGADAAESDMVAATSIQSDINAALVSDGGETTVVGGDSFQFEKASTKYHLGDNVTGVVSSYLNYDELPTLLAEGKYMDKDNDEFDYEQKITMDANLQLTMFEHNDYAEDVPTIGFEIPSGNTILTYTLDFRDEPLLDDIDTTDLPMMGKEYYVLTNNTAGTQITLLDSASTATLSEGDSITLNGKDVSVAYISSSEVKLSVDGENTNSLNEGDTYKLSDGSYVGIKDIMYAAKDTGISQVEFSLGSGKLKLVNGSNVQLNDQSVTGLTSTVSLSTSGSDTTVTQIDLIWAANTDMFLTEDSELTFPEFETVKLSFGGLTYPAEETIEVAQGSETYAVLNNFPLKDGVADIPILYATTNGAFAGIGKDATSKLVTGTTTINYTESTDDYFVASYKSGDDAESYFMRPTNFLLDGANDEVDFEYMKDGEWTSLKTGVRKDGTVSIGNVELTVGPVTSTGASSNKTVGLAAGTNMNFNMLYSAEGLEVYLPVANNSNNATTVVGQINFNTSAVDTGAVGTGHNATSFHLVMTEEDKDGAIASGDTFNITVGWDSSTTAEVEVSSVDGEEATFKEIGDTDVWRSFMYSALATEFLNERPSSGQDSVKIMYHGGEVEASVYITSAEATLTSESGVAIVNDAASVSGKNVVVVGGSAINAVAAELIGDVRGPAFTDATGVAAGSFLVETFAYNGKLALVVAGYDAADTTKAATYLTNTDDEIMVEAGMKYTGSSATEATLVTA